MEQSFSINQSREAWLDNAKMFAIICVIYGHMALLFANGVPRCIQGFIVAFNMPLFVILSGYTTLSSLLRIGNITALIEYAKKILLRMMIPAVTLSAVVQLFHGTLFDRKLWMIFAMAVVCLMAIRKWRDHIPGKTIQALADIGITLFLLGASLFLNMFWFLSMLLKLQLSAAIFCWIGNAWMKPTRLIVAAGFLLWVLYYFVDGGWTFEMSVYFAIGLIMKQYGLFAPICRLSFWKVSILLIVGILLSWRYTIGYEFYDYGLKRLVEEGIGYVYLIRILVALSLSLAAIRFIFAFAKSYSWFSRMGQFTLAFYTIHVAILETALIPTMYVDNTSNWMWITGLLMAIILAVVTYLLILICGRFEITRSLVLGIWNK